MNIASINANTANTSAVRPVEPVKADTNGQGKGAQPSSPVPTSRSPTAPAPIASQLAPATVRALFAETGRAAFAPQGALPQVLTAPAPAIAPLAAGLVAALAAQKAGKGAPAEPERTARTGRKTARGAADPAKTLSENLSPETVSALIQAVQRRRDDPDDGGLSI